MNSVKHKNITLSIMNSRKHKNITLSIINYNTVGQFLNVGQFDRGHVERGQLEKG
jgi:hypothetical protein